MLSLRDPARRGCSCRDNYLASNQISNSSEMHYSL